MARPRRPIRAWQLPEERPVPQGQAAVMEAALDRALVRSLGALPVLLSLCEQLGLRAIVNRRCSPDGEAPEDLDLGVVALVLALNRLQALQPLVHAEGWVAQGALGELLGTTPASATTTGWRARWTRCCRTWMPSGRTWW